MKVSYQTLYRAGLVFTEAIERKDMDLAKELSPLLLWGLNQVENAEQKPAIQMPKVTYFGNVLKDVKEDSGEAAAPTIDRLERAHKDETDAWYEMYKAEHEHVKALQRKVEELYVCIKGCRPNPELHVHPSWDKEYVKNVSRAWQSCCNPHPGWSGTTVSVSP